MLHPTKPFYRYDLTVEIPATEVAVLVDALEGEPFSLRDRLGRDELQRQLEEQEIRVHLVSEERWPELERDLRTLSVYLSEPISGREIHVEPGPDGPRLEGWVILGRRGETERIALALSWDADEQAPVELGIDEEDARRRWKDLPAWVRTTLQQRSPALVQS